MVMNEKERHLRVGQVVLNLVFIVICLCYILPMCLVISASFSDGTTLNEVGFALIPKSGSLAAYNAIFKNPHQIIRAYEVTIFFTAVTTILSIVVMSMAAYSLSRRDFALRKPITFILFFTTLFSGGMVPSYILNVSYLHMGNSIWIYIIPSLVNVWNVIVLRTNFQAMPESLIEAATIDGAGELRICFTIVIPLCTPAIASIGFLMFIAKWNDWFTAKLYINKDMSLYSLQYLLQKLLAEVDYAKQLVASGMANESDFDIPPDSYRFAMAVIAAGPMIFVFPFFQKYFAKGLTIGAVKG